MGVYPIKIARKCSAPGTRPSPKDRDDFPRRAAGRNHLCLIKKILILVSLFSGILFSEVPTGNAGPVSFPAPAPDQAVMIVSLKSGKAVSVADSSGENLANILLNHPHGGLNQSWRLMPVGNGNRPVFALISLKSGKVMDVMGYSREDGANIQQFKYYGTLNQRWEILPHQGEDIFQIVSVNSGKCMEAENGETEAGTNIRQSACDGQDHQLWRISPNIHLDRIFQIISKKSGLAIDIDANRIADGANIQQFKPHGRENQLWTLWPDGRHKGVPAYAFISCHSGKALDVDAFSRRDGANVQQFRYKGGDNQRWLIQDVGGGYCRIVSVHSGKCLEVAGADDAPGANVRQGECSGQPHQTWRLSDVDYAYRGKDPGLFRKGE